MFNCRICLGYDSELTSLFSLARRKYLPEVIYNISGVKILRKLEPEALICSKCKKGVLLAERIILCCQESEEYVQNQRLRKTYPWDEMSLSPLSCEGRHDDYNSSDMRSVESDELQTAQLDQHTVNENEEVENQRSNDRRKSEKTKKYELHCEHCDFGSKTARALVKHRKEVHQIDDNNIFPCKMCEKRFPWKSTLNRHIQNYHKTLPEDKKFLCIECGNIYTTQKYLIEHQKQRHGPRRFRCVESNCKQTFTRAFTLRRHFFTTHQNVPSYHCSDCNENFKIYDHWKYHNRTVHNDENRDFHIYKKVTKRASYSH